MVDSELFAIRDAELRDAVWVASLVYDKTAGEQFPESSAWEKWARVIREFMRPPTILTKVVESKAEGQVIGFSWVKSRAGLTHEAILDSFVAPDENTFARLLSETVTGLKSSGIDTLTTFVKGNDPEREALLRKNGFLISDESLSKDGDGIYEATKYIPSSDQVG